MLKDIKKPRRLLIVEDNDGDMLIVRELLEETMIACDITEAASFKEAVSILAGAKTAFDVILLDLTLRDKSGEALIIETLKIARLCPIIILTGYEDIDFSIRAISMGISDYLVKDNLSAMNLEKSVLYSIERRRSAAHLEESEKRFSDLFNLSPQPMWVYRVDNLKFVQVNNAATEHYGYSREEFLQMTIMDIRKPDRDLPEEQSAGNVWKNIRYSGLFTHYKKSGELIDVEMFSNPIQLDGVDCRSAIAIDMTMKNLFDLKLRRAIIKAQENERYEIGSELHDNVCQILAASLMSISAMKGFLKPEGMRWYTESVDFIRLSIKEIRNLSHRLAPAFTDQIPLEEALKKLFDSLKLYDHYKVHLFIHDEIKLRLINPDIQLSLYRILQEQLSNIVKYAKAKEISVDLNLRGDKIFMRIGDDGIGYNVNTTHSGIGRSNMMRRAALFSGRLEIDSSPGHGCVVAVEIPVNITEAVR